MSDIRFANPENRFVQEVYVGNEYGFLNHYSTVIDIGANIGTFSVWMYDHADKIYAVEPAEENVKSILETIRLNDFTNIIVKQMAISDKSIMKPMYRNGEAEKGGWKLDEAGDIMVDCRTLEDFMDSCDIKYADLVKMDVEGEELRILKTDLFPKDRIGTIIGEFHHGVYGLKETLEWLGFSYKEFKGNHFIARHL